MAKGQIKQAQAKIDQKQFEKLCGLQCTKTEITGYFGVSEQTLLRWCKETYNEDFGTIFEQKKGTGKIAIRRFQLQQAEKNPTMAIWLGKQYLGQRDNFEDVNNEEIEKAKEIIVSIRKSVDDK